MKEKYMFRREVSEEVNAYSMSDEYFDNIVFSDELGPEDKRIYLSIRNAMAPYLKEIEQKLDEGFKAISDRLDGLSSILSDVKEINTTMDKTLKSIDEAFEKGKESIKADDVEKKASQLSYSC